LEEQGSIRYFTVWKFSIHSGDRRERRGSRWVDPKEKNRIHKKKPKKKYIERTKEDLSYYAAKRGEMADVTGGENKTSLL